MTLIKRRTPDTSKTQFSHLVPPLLQQIYAARDVYSQADIAYQLTDLLHPSAMKGLDQAACLIADAVEAQQRILIVGDFDCDGATSSALAVSALTVMGAHFVDFLVPNRFDYGYGLTPEIVAVAASRHPDMIITVDNGISSIEGVDAANQRGITVIVTDHHLPGHVLPAAAAIVNPNQPGCEFPSKHLAGVGVIFYVMSAVRSVLRSRDWFTRQQLVEPNMAEYLDLVALGTVADVVTLDHNNRVMVAQGLQRIRAGRVRPGIKALIEVANRNPEKILSSDFGFAVGPRLNAAGRLDDISLGIQCLLSNDPFAAREMAVIMDELNKDRRLIETGMQQQALKSLATVDLQENDSMPWGLCLYQADWHQGVIGILASRIKDKFHRPVIVFADASNDGGTSQELKGSARSIKGLHIRDTLDAVATRYPHLLTKFGGHSMAAGMSILKSNYAAFCKAFDEEVRQRLSEDDLQAVLLTDGELAASDFDLLLAEQLRNAGPWGQHFPEPLFDGVFRLLQQRIVGEKHLKMVLAIGSDGKHVIDAIAFNVDRQVWPNTMVDSVQLVYKLDINEFRGERIIQLLVDYIEPVSLINR